MPELNTIASYGNEHKNLRIVQAYGAATAGLQLYVEDFYYGTIKKKNGEWLADLNDKALEEITSDDIQVLGQRIDDSKLFQL